MIITADEIYARMQHSTKKPHHTKTHTDDDNKQRDFKKKNLKASKSVYERKLQQLCEPVSLNWYRILNFIVNL